MSLRTRMGGALALVIIAATVVLGVVNGRTSTEQIRQRIGQSLATDASRMAERLNYEMSARARELALLAALDPLWDLPDIRPPAAASPPLPNPPGLTHVQSLLDGLKHSFAFYTWIAITDPQGRVLAATDPASVGTDISTRASFRDGLRGRPTREGTDVARPPPAPAVPKASPAVPPTADNAADPDDRRVMDLARPIRGTDGSVIGVIVAQLSWQWIRTIAQAALTPDPDGKVRRELVLVSNQDTVLLGPREMLGARLTLPAVARARAGFYDWTVEQWPDGQDYLTGTAFAAGEGGFPGAGSQEMKWTVLVREKVGVAFADVYAQLRAIFILGGILAAVFALIGWLVSGWITAPLKRIAAAAERLRLGDNVELPRIEGPAEIESLSNSLRALVATLTRKQVALDEMEELALHDPLTGLYNRNGLRVRLQRALEQARAEGSCLLLFVGDLDGFKAVNDTLGHACGDMLLRQVAGRFSAAVRQGDVVARLGGDEFVMALRAPRGFADPAARSVAKRVLESIGRPYDIDGRRVQIGCSLGGACWPDHADPEEVEAGGDSGIDAVMNKADAVLYSVKRNGKGRILLHGEPVGVA